MAAKKRRRKSAKPDKRQAALRLKLAARLRPSSPKSVALFRKAFSDAAKCHVDDLTLLTEQERFWNKRVI